MLHPAYPDRLISKKQYLASGVLAAFECKLTLRKRDMPKIAATARAVQRLAEVRTGSLYSALHSPLAYGVLAHSSEWSKLSEGDSEFKLRLSDPVACRKIDELLDESLKGNVHPRETLDVLCVADLACWTRFITVSSKAGWPSEELWQASRRLYGWPEDGAVCDQYSRWAKIDPAWEGPPNPLYVLISKLWRRLAWEIADFRPLADYWNLADVPGRSGGAGAVRNWDLSVLGDLGE